MNDGKVQLPNELWHLILQYRKKLMIIDDTLKHYNKYEKLLFDHHKIDPRKTKAEDYTNLMNTWTTNEQLYFLTLNFMGSLYQRGYKFPDFYN
jgi:hypothetical protein